MWQPSFFGFFLALLSIILAIDEVQSIHGSKDAAPGQHTYSAVLRKNGVYFCSGSVISKNHVLSAAYCIIPNPKAKPERSPMQVVVGTTDYNDLGPSGFVADVVAIFIPKIYLEKDAGSIKVGDVAVLKVGQDLNLGIKNIGLSKLFLPEDMSYAGLPTESTGFGNFLHSLSKPSTSSHEASSGKLRAVKTQVLSVSDCQKYYVDRLDKKKHLCALIESENPSTGFCPGDVGGPLVFNKDTLIGVLSGYVTGCGPNIRPYIYTKILAFQDFIKRATTDKNDKDIHIIILPVSRLSIDPQGLYA